MMQLLTLLFTTALTPSAALLPASPAAVVPKVPPQLVPALPPAIVPIAQPRLALRPEEVAFLDAISCDASNLRQARALYKKYGVVRLERAAPNAQLLARQATSAGVVADAFSQKRRRDRYTIHLRGDDRKWRGDGSDSLDDSAGDGRLEHLAPAVADWLDDATRPWRRVCGDFDSVIGLAELVVSLPGGAAQRWHYDGVGATAQVACCNIDAALGPTELVPRVLPEDYVHGRRRWARGPYDLTTLLSRVGWVFLRPFAPELIRSRRLLPATVRLCGAAGDVVVYDAAMFHRGGANRADRARPILAIHVRPG